MAQYRYYFSKDNSGKYVQADHKNIARNVSREAITLLKNTDGTLPLSTRATLKVFGDDAQNNPDGINACNQRSCNKGVLAMGWGSGMLNDQPASHKC